MTERQGRSVSPELARRIAYYNVAEYAIAKVLEHLDAEGDRRLFAQVLAIQNNLFSARNNDADRALGVPPEGAEGDQ